jgi:hypothetical protein
VRAAAVRRLEVDWFYDRRKAPGLLRPRLKPLQRDGKIHARGVMANEVVKFASSQIVKLASLSGRVVGQKELGEPVITCPGARGSQKFVGALSSDQSFQADASLSLSFVIWLQGIAPAECCKLTRVQLKVTTPMASQCCENYGQGRRGNSRAKVAPFPRPSLRAVSDPPSCLAMSAQLWRPKP